MSLTKPLSQRLIDVKPERRHIAFNALVTVLHALIWNYFRQREAEHLDTLEPVTVGANVTAAEAEVEFDCGYGVPTFESLSSGDVLDTDDGLLDELVEGVVGHVSDDLSAADLVEELVTKLVERLGEELSEDDRRLARIVSDTDTNVLFLADLDDDRCESLAADVMFVHQILLLADQDVTRLETAMLTLGRRKTRGRKRYAREFAFVESDDSEWEPDGENESEREGGESGYSV